MPRRGRHFPLPAKAERSKGQRSRKKALHSALWRYQLAWAWEEGPDEQFGKHRGCRGQTGELGWLPSLEPG